MSKRLIAYLTIALSLIIDQASKVWVKLTMKSGDEFNYIGEWARIHFVENEGMAFGMSFGAGMGKFLLTFFRIIAVIFISYYLRKQITSAKSSRFFVFAMALILAGAIGNIIDSIFFGQIFSHSEGQIATLFPAGGGYAGWFHGRVVDMFYFPIIRGTFPQWIPFWGGEPFEFFRFIFNVSDACITVGVALILIFQKRFFEEEQSLQADVTKKQPS
ncbi:MAG: lipoprotein signal peptidase [Sphingobacteriales bacterium]|nr:lipoprotein signal peptidase [Sphingobacteriales bacterium]